MGGCAFIRSLPPAFMHYRVAAGSWPVCASVDRKGCGRPRIVRGMKLGTTGLSPHSVGWADRRCGLRNRPVRKTHLPFLWKLRRFGRFWRRLYARNKQRRVNKNEDNRKIVLDVRTQIRQGCVILLFLSRMGLSVSGDRPAGLTLLSEATGQQASRFLSEATGQQALRF